MYIDTDLVDRALGATSQPIHITAAQAHQKAWLMYKLWGECPSRFVDIVIHGQ